ncbi:hypothetical protein GY21_06435 [Cryobacterium roopkundense]|uniref:LysM domain-containing protein n=1 Tax=Cryobacterium roopkundense TaxID=1001240 RepID=A0A099JNI4_9MICO|nr:LysM peptidoglycan-binding domain-containing protein [Cryobacterium roopkundense]KGJ79023.1 hypothetical protein GY21_06435 [Cryobacterium roopkundense]MBB5640368.1 hypothetical protein [Cryobacterium roopkundense]
MSATLTTTKLRLTRRGRGVIMALVAAPVVAAAIVLALNGGGAFAAGAGPATGPLQTELVSFTYVTVAAGESLWDVAQNIAPSKDPRDVIVEIMSLNQMPGDSVQPGQRLALPTGY